MIIDHPMRRQLHNELHARPSIYFDAPAVVWHDAFYVQDAIGEIPQSLLDLNGANTLDGKSGIVRTTSGQIKWEMHTEFVSLTYVVPWNGDPDVIPLKDATWTDLVGKMPGERITSVEVLVGKAGTHDVKQLLGSHSDAVASTVGAGDAEVWTTFRLNERNAMRIVVLNRALNDYRTGRMVRRILEIEDYRMMALLSLPLAQDAFVQGARFDSRLRSIVDELGAGTSRQDALLDRIAKLSADIIDFSGKTRERFSATAAYADLVFARLEEIREQRLDGHQRLGVFIDRRFRPAVRFCHQADKKIENCAVRTSRASDLLRTSVQVELEQQNALLLESMEKRVSLQVKLQEAVEGLSIVAISYYALGIIKMFLESFGKYYHNEEVLKGLYLAAIPAVILLVWFIIKRTKQKITGGGH